jgi:hypothetical protein
VPIISASVSWLILAGIGRIEELIDQVLFYAGRKAASASSNFGKEGRVSANVYTASTFLLGRTFAQLYCVTKLVVNSGQICPGRKA